jgi:hypothetical protein
VTPRASVLTTAALATVLGAPALAAAGPSKKEMLQARADHGPRGAGAAPPAAGPQLDRARWHKELRRRVGKKPAPVINVFNLWTREMIAVDAGRSPGVPEDLVNRFLRCHFTNHEASMASELFRGIVAAANHFKVSRIDVVSGFRAPKYNLILRKKGRRVARESHHTHGRAVDFRLPSISAERLRDWARKRRLGGVGYYQTSGFVHLDTGPVRYWVTK